MKRSIPEFIDQLVILTKSGDLDWIPASPKDFTKENKFEPPAITRIQTSLFPNLSEGSELESFVAAFSGGKVILRRFAPPATVNPLASPSYLILGLQPGPAGEISSLNGQREYQAALIRLYNLISHKSMPVEDYMERFFSHQP